MTQRPIDAGDAAPRRLDKIVRPLGAVLPQQRFQLLQQSAEVTGTRRHFRSNRDLFPRGGCVTHLGYMACLPSGFSLTSPRALPRHRGEEGARLASQPRLPGRLTLKERHPTDRESTNCLGGPCDRSDVPERVRGIYPGRILSTLQVATSWYDGGQDGPSKLPTSSRACRFACCARAQRLCL